MRERLLHTPLLSLCAQVTADKASQALKQLVDIVSVWAVVDYTGTNSLTRELAMIKVCYLPPQPPPAAPSSPQPLQERAPAAAAAAAAAPAVGYRALIDAQPHRAAVRDIGQLFGAEVVDVGTYHITFQLTSWSKRVEAFIASLQPFGIIETARSGVVAMLRSNVAGTESDSIPTPATDRLSDAAALPPG